jgi:hypothetical protein
MVLLNATTKSFNFIVRRRQFGFSIARNIMTDYDQYCLKLTKEKDYENYLIGLLYAKEYRSLFYAIRAFNIEV